MLVFYKEDFPTLANNNVYWKTIGKLVLYYQPWYRNTTIGIL